jgi:N-acylneuraminate cytidylyltransferase
MAMFHPEYAASRSQDLEVAYRDCGMFYWYRPALVLEKNTLYTDNTATVVVSGSAAQDIDTPEDWKLAELKYKLLHR